MSSFNELVRRPDACLMGTWVKLSSLETLELLAFAGFDFVVLDMEHAPHTFETTYRCIVAAQGFGMKALVRLPDAVNDSVQRLLDSGADGLLVPRVRTPEEARRTMDGMLFSPRGSRGVGITSRAGKWGMVSMPEYTRRGDQDILRCVQLEDQDSLRKAEAILSTEGVNAAFVGPGDLSLSSGKPATDPENAALIEHLLKTGNALGIPCGTAVGDAAAARKARERGFRFVMVSNDLTMFGKAAVELAKGFKG